MDRIERIRQSYISQKMQESDTHDYIQRHDPDFNKNKSKQRDHWKDHDEDMTDISVESLIIFLEGLKRDNPSYKKDQTDDVDPKMKKAISAYDTSKHEVQKRYTYLDEEHAEVDPQKIDELLTSLNHMLNQNIDHITLIPATSFLKSIETTVEKYESL